MTGQSTPPPLRVALFTRYTRLGASSRLRFLQFLPTLQAHGIEVDVFPLFDDAYLARLYNRQGRPVWRVLCSYLRRAQALVRSRHHDVLWIEKELFPYLPRAVERLWQPARTPAVVDYDDAVFHNYDLSRHAAVRHSLGHKIDGVMGAAFSVTAGNGYLAARARRAGATRIAVIPTVVDVARYQPANLDGVRTPRVVVIGWIGSPSTEHYVLPLAPALRELCESGRARVVLVGASRRMETAMNGVPVEVRTWTEATEGQDIASFDIGIMPLPDEPWERGKCGYKLIQYMACGLPVVASPVGVNQDIVEDGITGLLASEPTEWTNALSALMADAALRDRMGRVGRERVEQVYSLQVQGARIAQVLHTAAAGRNRRPPCAD